MVLLIRFNGKANARDKFTQVNTNCGFYEAETPPANLCYREWRVDGYLAEETSRLASAHPQ